MKLLIYGGGGREHTLAWKLQASPEVDEVLVTPANGGMEDAFSTLSMADQGLDQLAVRAEEEEIDLTVVGPEAPLAEGIVDSFQQRGLRIFGPDRRAAIIEGSKVFAKELMDKHGIPTGGFRVFDDSIEARAFLDSFSGPVVVKAEGLAAGKGVVVASDGQQASQAVKKIMDDRAFGAAGERVLVEEFIKGEEASILALTDGEDFLTLAASQDHKAAYDGDRGPNTGGMGAFSPAPIIDAELETRIEKEILRPTLRAMKSEGRSYRGVLYAGLMITPEGDPMVLEFNCRFGDPETQAVIPRLEDDLLPAMMATIEGGVGGFSLSWDQRVALCVIMASGGYPVDYTTGYPLQGLDELALGEDLLVFHAGTRKEEGQLVTDGGRVLGVTALADGFPAARDKAYRAVERINFKDCHYRKDIGSRAVN